MSLWLTGLETPLLLEHLSCLHTILQQEYKCRKWQ